VNPAPDKAKQILESADIIACTPLILGTNHKFLVNLDAGDGNIMPAIYKPKDGEKPLIDYPSETLYLREYASYSLSQLLGWPDIPVTVIRNGPYGLGSMQCLVDFDPNINYFHLRDRRLKDLATFAVFDVLVNNGDRKGGHFLQDSSGNLWSIDHGLTFHHEPRLRSVMLEYGGLPFPRHLLKDVERVGTKLDVGGEMHEILSQCINSREMDALMYRLQSILNNPIYPTLYPHLDVPWPLI